MVFIIICLLIAGISVFAIGWTCFFSTESKKSAIFMILLGETLTLYPVMHAVITGQSLLKVLILTAALDIILTSVLIFVHTNYKKTQEE